MKKFFYATMCIVSLCLSGCGYDDDEVWNAINDQEERIAALEEWQKTANENIAALQAIVNGNDYITSVEEIKEGDEIIGYTINFHRQGEVTIYNGKDGEKGDMPVIGVSEGEDGRWYWTVNGELLEDADGNPVCANGKDGEDGEDGEDGADGSSSSGVTPVIKLGSELGEGYNQYASYISVDGGRTWTQINVTYDSSGSVLESVEGHEGYYEFRFYNQKEGYYNIVDVPIYSGGLQFRCRADYYDDLYIYNGELGVEAGEPFSILVLTDSSGEWTCDTKSTEDWEYTRNSDRLVFANAPDAGKSFILKFTYVDSANKVTNYQITVTSYKSQIIAQEDNPKLVQALVNDWGNYILNEEGDVEVTPQLIQDVKSIRISGQNITSLEGIEAFENLEYLDCSNNPLTSLDVSAFKELKELYCSNCFNQSPASRSYENDVLDLSENTKLERLSCMNNQLISIDVSKNTALTFLELDNNQLTTLDISQNTLLETLWVPANKLTVLNVASNEALRNLYCNDNQLIQLDVSNNTALQELSCGNQHTANNAEQQLILVINEAQQPLWESNWKNNYNVVVSDEAISVSGGSGSNFGNGGVY